MSHVQHDLHKVNKIQKCSTGFGVGGIVGDFNFPDISKVFSKPQLNAKVKMVLEHLYSLFFRDRADSGVWDVGQW